jgi:hypothetical protein
LEYFHLSKDKVSCCDNEEEIVALEKHKIEYALGDYHPPRECFEIACSLEEGE